VTVPDQEGTPRSRGVPLPLDGPALGREGPGRGRAHVLGESAGATVRRSVLPGGVRVLTETVPGLRSVTVGAWVGVGSRDEASGHHGSTHFLEHLLFKGTARRSAMDIATAFDAVGGEANAATGKEHTCYYARVLDEDLPMAVDVIADMVTSATIADDDVDGERGVILEELAMNDDDPSDVVHELFAELVLGDHPLGRPIGGTPEAIREVPAAAIREHWAQHYEPGTLVVTAAGGADHEQVCELVERALATSGWPQDAAGLPRPRRTAGDDVVGAGTGSVLTVRRSTEQANLVLGGLGLVATDPRRFGLSVLNAVLGGGMSSRLFQEVRELRGLAYSVYSFAAGYADSGYFGLYAGCSPGRVAEVVALLDEQWRAMATDGISEAELERGIGQVSGSLVLGLEDTGSRMSRLGKAELVHGEFLGLDEALARIRAVTRDDVRALAAELYARPRSLAVVGPFDADPVPTLP
jgi:predicted Zn-dependent peptidase